MPKSTVLEIGILRQPGSADGQEQYVHDNLFRAEGS